MDISFTGIKNIGGYRKQISQVRKMTHDRLAMQLTNEDGSRDLEKFSELLNSYPDRFNKGFLVFDFKKTKDISYSIDINSKPFFKFSKYSDDWEFPTEQLEKNKGKNLQLMMELFKKIINPNEPKPLEESYLRSEYCIRNMMTQKTSSLAEVANDVETCHDIDSVLGLSKTIFSDFMEKTKDYFENTTLFLGGIKNAGGFAVGSSNQIFKRLILTLDGKETEGIKKVLNITSEGENRNVFKIDLTENRYTKVKNININNNPIAKSKFYLPIFESLAKLLTYISKSEKNISFPNDYIDEKFLNSISKDVYPEGSLFYTYKITPDNLMVKRDDMEIFSESGQIKRFSSEVLDEINNQVTSILEQ